MQSGIYMIRCNINGKRYIGSAKNIADRLYKHFRLLEKFEHWNYQLQDDWGEFTAAVFELKTLEYCPEEKLIEREQWYFDNWKPEYNLCPNARSRLGSKASRPVRQPPCSEEKKEKIRKAHIGMKHTEEALENIRKANTITNRERARKRRIFTNEEIRDIRLSLMSYLELAKKYNTGTATIGHIIRYETYKDVD